MICPFSGKLCSAECPLYFKGAQLQFACTFKQIAVALMGIQQKMNK